MSFLPKTYDVPASTGNYFKYQDGANKIRILSQPILGWRYWETTEDGKKKPIRIRMNEPLVLSANADAESTRHFWAFIVWNYKLSCIQIMEVTQKGIQKSIKALSDDEDWGDPTEYDITITKSGEKLETEYSVMPNKPKPMTDEMKKAFESKIIRLEALYDGADPFETERVNPEDVKV